MILNLMGFLGNHVPYEIVSVTFRCLFLKPLSEKSFQYDMCVICAARSKMNNGFNIFMSNMFRVSYNLFSHAILNCENLVPN